MQGAHYLVHLKYLPSLLTFLSSFHKTLYKTFLFKTPSPVPYFWNWSGWKYRLTHVKNLPYPKILTSPGLFLLKHVLFFQFYPLLLFKQPYLCSFYLVIPPRHHQNAIYFCHPIFSIKRTYHRDEFWYCRIHSLNSNCQIESIFVVVYLVA